MNGRPSLKAWFFASARWGIGKQLGAAAAVIVAALLITGVIIQASGGGGDAQQHPRTLASQTTLGAAVESSSTTSTSTPLPSTSTPRITTTAATTTSDAATTTSSTSTTSSKITTAPPPTTDVIATDTGGSIDALDLLATIPVTLEHSAGYSRDLFAVWSDLDGDGCDTRAEVLIDESLIPVQLASGCTVVSGTWLSAYDGLTVTSPSDLDVDHVVSLKEAWDSGAWQWTPDQRIAYGNDTSDPRVLAAVTATSNREKGDKDPSNWLPPNAADLCTYLGDWVAIKAEWHLSMDQSEWGRVKNQLRGSCPGLRVTN